MAAIAVTADKVGTVFPGKAEIYSGVCGEDITPGQLVKHGATGKLIAAIATGAFLGVAMEAVAIRPGSVTVLPPVPSLLVPISRTDYARELEAATVRRTQNPFCVDSSLAAAEFSARGARA